MEAVQPVAASFLGTVTSESFDLAESFYQDHTLLLAIQCHARGWHELARTAYKPYDRIVARDATFLRRILAMWARDASLDRLRDPAVDRRVIFRQLKACAEVSVRDEGQRNDPVIDDLERTVASPPPTSETARWIEPLLEVTYVRREREEADDDPTWDYHPVYESMLGQWFERMPVLLENTGDRQGTATLHVSNIRCALGYIVTPFDTNLVATRKMKR